MHVRVCVRLCVCLCVRALARLTRATWRPPGVDRSCRTTDSPGDDGTTAATAVTVAAAAVAAAPSTSAAGDAAVVACAYKLDVEQIRREILSGGRGRRTRSEQGPHPRDVQLQQHLWAGGGRAWTGRSPWAVKRTSAPAMGTQTSGSMRVALVLRTRRSWPVAPLKTRRSVTPEFNATVSPDSHLLFPFVRAPFPFPPTVLPLPLYLYTQSITIRRP